MGSCSSGQMAFSCHQLKEKKKTADDHKYVECLKKNNNNNVHTVYTQDSGVCSHYTMEKKANVFLYCASRRGIFKCHTLFY